MIEFLKNILLLTAFIILIVVLSDRPREEVALPETIEIVEEIVVEKPVVEEKIVVEEEGVISPEPVIKKEGIVVENPFEVIVAPLLPTVPISFSQINTSVRESIVNILCTSPTTLVSPISGSGVLISDTGVILTNAHIAQYYLLKEYANIDCVIRIGSPAQPRYRANLLYISPEWVNANADLLTQENPKGTGEFDYGFLYITERTDVTKELPEVFPYTSIISTAPITQGDGVLIAGYPAGFLGGLSIQKALYAASSVTSINKLFTFGAGDLDLISVGGSVVAQKGSSGGAVVSRNNKLIGIVVTSTLEETTEERDLRAITLEYINRDFLLHNNRTLEEFMNVDLEEQATAFNSLTSPVLSTIIINAINR